MRDFKARTGFNGRMHARNQYRWLRECKRRTDSSMFFRKLWIEPLEERTLLSIDTGWTPQVCASWFQDLTNEPAMHLSSPATDSSLSSNSLSSNSPSSNSLTNASPTTLDIIWQGESLETASNQWIVQLTPDAASLAGSVSGVESILETNAIDVRVVRGLGMVGMVTIEVQAGADLEAVEDWLSSNTAVAYFEPNAIVTASVVPNDPSFNQLWGMNNTGQTGGKVDADIDAPEAWDVAKGSSSIVVGIIDTGVDYTHPDLAANIWTNPGEIAGNGIDDDHNGFVDDVHGYDFVNNDGDPMDDHYHGTHVAGTIAAVGNNGVGVAGVNWSSSIMALKFLDSQGGGTNDNAVRAVNYATMMRTTYGVNIRVTNNSWGGGTYSSALYNAIAANRDAGILFVAAAGNDSVNNDSSPHYPSNYDLDNIIAVAATDSNDSLASFSCYGPTSVDLAAPGVNIYSTSPGNSYRTLSGTSMATPHVTGTVALAWSTSPNATAAQVRNAILAGVDPIASLTGKMVTGGRLNALGAINKLGLMVTGCDPAQDSIVSAPPTDFIIHFSAPCLSSSINAGDLTVNGVAADSFSFLPAHTETVTFHYASSPVTVQGPQNMSIAAGAILRDGDLNPVTAWNASFRYDAHVMAVASTDPLDGTVVTIPFNFLDFNFDEPVNPGSIGTNDLTLSQGSVVTASLVDSDTVRYTLTGVNAEGILTVNMAAGAVADSWGNPGAAYSGSFTTDIGTVPFPVPLTSSLPLGSLIYSGSASDNIISLAGDTDSFTINLDAGQTLTALVIPAVGLRPNVSIAGPGGVNLGSADSPGAGADVVLQTVAAATAGVYTVTVGSVGGTTGKYTLQLTLNAALETEEHGGAGDNTQASAQEITGFISLGGSAQRAAVLGTLPSSSGTAAVYGENLDSGTLGSQLITDMSTAPDDWYKFTLDANQTTTLALSAAAADAKLELYDSEGHLLVTGRAASNLSQVIDSYAATAAGTYYAHLTGNGGDYRLVVTKNAAFDTERNDTTSTGQSLPISPASHQAIVLGYIEPSVTGVEPDDYPSGTVLTNIVPGITLTAQGSSSAITSLSASYHSTGSRVFGYGSSSTFSDSVYLRAAFSNPVSSVSLDLVADDSNDPGFMKAYNSSGMLLQDLETAAPVFPSPGFLTMTITRPTADIAYIIAGGQSGQVVFFDHLVVNGGLASDCYIVSVNSGDPLVLSTATPAGNAGEFVNNLDPKIELYNPSGSLVASDDNSGPDGRNAKLTYVATTAGNYTIRVLAASDKLGEYILSVKTSLLTLSLPSIAAEGDGTVTGTIGIFKSLASDLVVNMSSSDTGRVTAPATVTIPAGATSAPFTLAIVDNSLLDGLQDVTISATAAGCGPGQGTIAVHDNETAVLSVSLPASAREGDGALKNAGVVTSSAAPTRDITVQLVSSDTSEITVPFTIVLHAGQTTAAFDVTVVDDALIDDLQTATVTASVEHWTSGSAGMDVLDNDRYLQITLPADAWEGQGTLSKAGTVRIGGALGVDLTVNLSSNDTSEMLVPASVTIAAGATSATFDVTIVDDGVVDGKQTAAATAGATGFSDVSAATTIHDNEMDHFSWDAIGGPQVAAVPFAAAVRAKNVDNETIVVYGGIATLTAAANGGPLPMTPASCAFVAGVWTGNVMVNALGSGVVLTAADGLGHTGGSNSFTVKSGPLASFQWSTIASPQYKDIPFTVTLTAKDANGFIVNDYNSNTTICSNGTMGVLDSFDQGSSDLANYTFTSTNNASITSSAAHDGPYGLQLGNTTEWMYRNDASVHVQQGQVFSTWLKSSSSSSGRAYFGFGSTATGTLCLVMGENSGTLSLIYVPGYSTYTDLASVPYSWIANHWYRFEVDWQSGGTIIGRLYDSDGLTLLATVTGFNNNITSGGIGFRGFGSTKYFDTVGSYSIPIPIAPTNATFFNGTWTGDITYLASINDTFLSVSDGAGHVGNSNHFDVQAVPPLVISMPTVAAEGDGTLANQGRVSILTPIGGDLLVTLVSQDTTEVTVPGSVTISAGQTSATFDVTIMDDAILDGSKTVRIAPSAAGYAPVSGTIRVNDNETAVLTVSVPAEAWENAGVLFNQGRVSMDQPAGDNVSVELSSNDTTEAQVPAIVIIPAGQTSASFDLTMVDDSLLDGTQTATITATVTNWTPGSASIAVKDDDPFIIGEIHGSKWNDLDGDGVWDAGEPGLPGWTVYIDSNNNGALDPGEPSAVTDADGNYALLNLQPGTYTVAEVQQAGWNQTYPTITSGSNRLFAMLRDSAKTIVELNPATGAEIRRITAPIDATSGQGGLAFDGTHLFFTGASSPRTLYELDPNTGAVVDSDTISAGTGNFDGLAYLNGKIYVQDYSASDILEFDPVADVVTRTLDINGLNGGITIVGGLSGIKGPDALLALSNAQTVLEINPTTGLITHTFSTSSSFYGVAVLGGNIYLGNGSSAKIDVYSRAGVYQRSITTANTIAALGGDDAGVSQSNTHKVIVAKNQIVTGVNFGNRKIIPSEIHGSKWSDLDGDGVWDAGEPGLPGWTVYIDSNHNGALDPGEPSAVTDADGNYALLNLLPGTYTVAEVQQTGWEQTYPLAASSRLFALLLSNSGAAIYELNPATGAVIRSFSTPSAILNSGPQGLAMGQGSLFYIDGYGSSPHTLWELNPDTGAVIDSDVVDAGSSSEIAGLGYLNGKVYIEKDATDQILVWDPVADIAVATLNVSANIIGGLTGAGDLGALFESGSAGQIYKIDPQNGAVLATLSPSGGPFTGGLAFVNGELIAAKYSTSSSVYRINPSTGSVLGTMTLGVSGYISALGGDGALGLPGVHAITVAKNQIVTGVNFGNQKIIPSEIHGSKWNDLDGDGAWDAGEPGLPGWTIYIDSNKNGALDPGEPSAVTDADGNYALLNLLPGTYTVAEVHQTGWEQTYPMTTLSRLFALRVSGGTGSNGSIYELNPATGAVIRIFSTPRAILGSGPQGLAMGQGSLFYIDGYGSSPHTLWELNPDTGAVIDSDVVDAGSSSEIAGLGYLNGKVYIEKDTTHQILVWDPVADIAVATLNVNANFAGGLTGASDLGALFESGGGGQIYKIDPNTGAVLATLSPSGGPFTGGLAYVNGELIAARLNTSSTVYRINPSTGSVLGTMSLGGSGYISALGGDGAFPGTHAITVAKNQIVTGVNFGNQKIIPSEIHGSKWNDLDGDGVWDAGEPGLPGWTIYIDSNKNGAHDPGEPSAVTDANGYYELLNLKSGTYTVAEVQQAGWDQSYPAAAFSSRLFALRVSGTSPTIYELDPTSGAVVNSFAGPAAVSSSGSQGLALGPNSLFYIDGSGTSGHKLWELNPNTGAVIDSDIVDAASPGEIAGLGYLNGKVYIEKSATDQIIVWNPDTDTAITTLDVGANLQGGLTGAGDLGVLFDSNGAGQIYMIDPATGAVLSTLDTGPSPYDGGLAYVKGELIAASRSSSSTVYRINPINGAVLGTITLGGGGLVSGLAGDQAGTNTQNVTVKNQIINNINFGDCASYAAIVAPGVMNEGDGVLSARGWVKLSHAANVPIVVNLSSSETTELAVPASITIPAGRKLGLFDLMVQDDRLFDGPRSVVLTADAPGYPSCNFTVIVGDNDPHHLSFDSIGSAIPAGSQFNVTVRAYDITGNVIPTYNETISLSCSGTRGPIPIDPVSISFHKGVGSTNVTIHDADKAATLQIDNGFGITGTSNTFAVTSGPLASFAWSPIYFLYLNVPASVTLTALDAKGYRVTDFTGVVSLSGFTDTSPIPITPTATGNFTDGVWTGNITVSQAASIVYFHMDDNAGHVADSNPIVVLTQTLPCGMPDLLASSDTGLDHGDRVTNLDNSDPTKTLDFRVNYVWAGCLVTIYADGIAIGSATASSDTIIVTTDGKYDLADGLHAITARQTMPGAPESLDSDVLEVTIHTVAPRVVALIVKGTNWSNDFLDAIDSCGSGCPGMSRLGYSLPVGLAQFKSLPWTNIDSISVLFDQSVILDQSAMSLRGKTIPIYNVADGTFHYDPTAMLATWTLPKSLAVDKLLLGVTNVSDIAGNALDGEWIDGTNVFPSGDGAAGGDFAFRFNVLPGDVNQDGAVLPDDRNAVLRSVGSTPGSSRYTVWKDLTGDARIISNDLSMLLKSLGKTLPAGEPSQSASDGEAMTLYCSLILCSAIATVQTSDILQGSAGNLSDTVQLADAGAISGLPGGAKMTETGVATGLSSSAMSSNPTTETELSTAAGLDKSSTTGVTPSVSQLDEPTVAPDSQPSVIGDQKFLSASLATERNACSSNLSEKVTSVAQALAAELFAAEYARQRGWRPADAVFANFPAAGDFSPQWPLKSRYSLLQSFRLK
jgi:subtilisin family serine protease/glutamine cyclotransferase